MDKETSQLVFVLVSYLYFFFTQRPHHPLQLFIVFFRKLSLQPLEFLLAQRIQALAIQLRHMKAINDNFDPFAEYLLCSVNKAVIHIGTNSLDRLAKLPRYAREKHLDRALFAI